MRRRSLVQDGFTLIEVLIALAIVSIALAAALRALGVSATGAERLQQHALALQAAGNRLAELRLTRAFPPVGRSSTPCPQGPLALRCDQVVTGTVNQNFRQVLIQARLPDGAVVAELSGMLSPLP